MKMPLFIVSTFPDISLFLVISNFPPHSSSFLHLLLSEHVRVRNTNHTFNYLKLVIY